MMRHNSRVMQLRHVWATCLVVFAAVMLVPGSAQAVGNFNNAVIADYAINNYPVGSYGGQCRAFVNNVVRRATGLNTGTGWPDYFAGFTNAGADRITDVGALKKGDIVQYGRTEADPSLHTFIIIRQISGSTYEVIDSNHNRNERVSRYNRAVTLNDSKRAYRLGRVETPPPPPPPPPPVSPKAGIDSIGAVDPTGGELTWYLRNTNSAGPPQIPVFKYGGASLVPLSGNWDGIHSDGIGVFDPNTATWYLRNSPTSGSPDVAIVQYGAGGWKPVVGDWDGNGTDTIGVFNPNTATWYLKNSNSGGGPDIVVQHGAGGWTPVVGDWDGNGTDTIGAVDPTGGELTWYLRNSNSAGPPQIAVFKYGGKGLVPVSGNWDGFHSDGIGVFDPGTATWYLRNSTTGGPADAAIVQHGAGGWKPVVGDWDGL